MSVGAVAVDREGRLAAATSTGGIWLKLPGRVGDSAIIGAGTYCSTVAGASATGAGDGILKLGICRRAVDALAERAQKPVGAVQEAIALASANKVDCGLILMTPTGDWAAEHNCRHMPRALLAGESPELLTFS